MIVVRTDSAASVAIEASLGGRVAAQAGSSGTTHVLALEGLAPAQTYSYRVLVDGAAAATGTFRTPGATGTAGAKRAVLGVIADQGSGGPNAKANADLLLARGVELLITAGDNAMPNGAPEDWDPKLFTPYAPLFANTTFWPTVGDHEYGTPGASGYLDAFVLPPEPGGERYYSFDWGDFHVASLDYQCWDPDVRDSPIGCTAAGMREWLEADLAASKAPWKVLSIHRPALASGKYLSNARIAAELIPIAEQYGVDLVLQAHNHSYERTWPVRGGAVVQRSYQSPGAPVYMTVGGGGDWIYEQGTAEPPEWSAFRATEYQHVVMTYECPTLRIESIRPDGTKLDEFTMAKDTTICATTAGGLPGGAGTPSPTGGGGANPPAGGGGGDGCASAPGAASLGAIAAAGAALLLAMRRSTRPAFARAPNARSRRR